jgi:beta-N-acetylhexosaminidase
VRTTPARALARALPVCAALLAGGCARVPPHAAAAAAEAAPGHAAWVEETLAGMTLEEKVGQMLVPQVFGDGAGPDEAGRVARWIAERHVGGLLVSTAPAESVQARLAVWQSQARLPLIVAADMEYGAGMRLRPDPAGGAGGTVFPFPLGMAATGDPELAREAGRITAREARAAGIHWLLAPVADLATTAANPVVNVRSFGADPALAARFVDAFVRGAEGAGVLATAKHFPGHGETTTDSHHGLPVLALDRARLDSMELVPFRAALAARASAVMPGHLALPAITGDAALPASLSHAMVTRLLRRELGFNGLVVTDALDMAALAGSGGPGEVAVAAVLAGADVLLKPADPDAVHDALVRAVRAHRLSEARIDASVRRILAAKARLDLESSAAGSPAAVRQTVGAAAHAAAAAEHARRSLVLLRDPAGHVPLDPRRYRSLALILIGSARDPLAGAALEQALGHAYGDVATVRLDERSGPAATDAALAIAARADAAVLATFRAPAAGLGPLPLPDYLPALAGRLARGSRPVVVVAFGDPFAPASLLPAAAYLLAWQPLGPHAQEAAARALAGRIPITGRSPVPLAGAPAGAGLRRDPADPPAVVVAAADAGDGTGIAALPAAVDRLMTSAVLGGAVPGAAVAIGSGGRIVHMRGYGTLDPRPGFGTATDSTIYDLASMTKAVATTAAVMLLYEDGRLDLDAPIHGYLREWRRGGLKEGVTVRHLLTHTAGLPVYSPLWRELSSRDAFIRRIGALGLEYAPGRRTLYSDFGMILLAEIAERVAGVPLERFLGDRLYAPLGMTETGFNPLGWGAERGSAAADPADADETRVADPALLARIAPTELDTIFRGTHVHGVVHDENAFAMGGVAGHAGLFSSARDLAVFAQMLLNGGFVGETRVLRPSTIALFTAAQPTGRGLGWDKPPRGAGGDAAFSPTAYGHTGFTGTSLWIDPERDVFVVLLTNRVNPTRANQRHLPLRRALHDLVVEAVSDLATTPRE